MSAEVQGAPDNTPRRRWAVAPAAPPSLAGQLLVPPLWAQLLHNRGITTPAQKEGLLAPGHSHDPMLLQDVDAAVQHLLAAIAAREHIAVYGDFDTDGVTATALLLQALRALGASAIPYIPNRVREGHGLNEDALVQLHQQGVTLIITVDTGITAVQEAARASALGMRLIITDHHALPEQLPEAAAVVTPQRPGAPYPFAHLTGAGLAFKIAQALYTATARPLDDDFFALAALGTVADMAPLLGENRYLVKRGLEALQQTSHPGLLHLLSRAGVAPIHVDTETISFTIAPRLNAAGRLESAEPSLALLTTTSPSEAQELAGTLERLNHQRQELTEHCTELADCEVAEQVPHEALLFVASADLVPGVNGLVASKLVERYYRPAVVVSMEGDVARGSGRSIPEFDLVHALRACHPLLERYGGHSAAAGFVTSAAHLPALRQQLQALARSQLQGAPLLPTLHIDAETQFRSLVGSTYRFLGELAPYGAGNPQPLFLTRGVPVTGVEHWGEKKQHLVLRLRQGGAVWDAVAFHQAKAWPTGGADRVDLVYSLGTDSFTGRERLRLQVRDFRPHAPG
ncbi:MAG: single-stranded-DNA-specific exonuclease RecJ [Chloroflexi bacterium]|nr:single-stranded-DNA-specific exonuclease RecJ [Chloroflexota bacterium]